MALKQTFMINSDLGMSKGKIAIQVAHGEVFYMDIAKVLNPENVQMHERFLDWRYGDNELMKKVAIKATQHEMIQMAWILESKGIWAHKVYDRGLTRVPQDSFTCLVVEPISEEQYKELFIDFKLL